MKKILAVAVAASLLLSACGRPITHEGKEYPTYGLLSSDTEKSDKMCYKLSIGNLIWSIILVETIVAPIYFIGFSLFNPIGPKDPAKGCGIDAKP